MYNKLPNTNKMQWEKVQTLSLFFQFTGIENNLLHYFNSTIQYSSWNPMSRDYYERVKWAVGNRVKMLDFQ